MQICFVLSAPINTPVSLEVGEIQFRQRVEQVNANVSQDIVREVDPLQVGIIIEEIGWQSVESVEAHVQIFQLWKILQIIFDDTFEAHRESENPFEVREKLVEILRKPFGFDFLQAYQSRVAVVFVRHMSA